MRTAADYQRAIRQGRRYRTHTLVAHYWCCEPSSQPARVGFSVSRQVGNSVVRHRVSRRLRHVSREQLASLPDGSLLVIRATPSAADADSQQLGHDLDHALRALRGSR